MVGKGLSRATRLGRPWKKERWRGGKIEGGLHGPCIIHTPCSIFKGIFYIVPHFSTSSFSMQFFCQNQAYLLTRHINTFTTVGKNIPLQRCKKCLQKGATFVAGATNVAGFYVLITLAAFG
jgi:hypothetical protein